MALGEKARSLSIHDVGAGGLPNALPELVHDQRPRRRLELREVPSAEPGLSPLEIWCNEAQERFVLGIDPERYELFCRIARARALPVRARGYATAEPQLALADRHFGNVPIDLPLEVLFGNTPQLKRDVRRVARRKVQLVPAASSCAKRPARVLAAADGGGQDAS